MPKFKATPRSLRDLMAESNITKQKDLAEKVGVKEPTISRFDSQKRYDIDVLVSLSRALNKPIEDLFIIEKNEERDAE